MSILGNIKDVVITQLIVGASVGALVGLTRYKERQRRQNAAAARRVADTELEPTGPIQPTTTEVVDPAPVTMKPLEPIATNVTVTPDEPAQGNTRPVLATTNTAPRKTGKRRKTPTRFHLVGDLTELDEMPVRERMRSNRKTER